MIVRPWQPSDSPNLWYMVERYLKETYKLGYDIAPTPTNVMMFVNIGMVVAAEHGTALVCLPNDLISEFDVTVILGWTLWRPSGEATLTTRGRTLVGMGTYVKDAWRGKGIAKMLHAEAERVGREQGYNFVDRVAIPGTIGAIMLEHAGLEPVATVYRRVLNEPES